MNGKAIHLGAQYYRPPFPNQQYWDKDFARIKTSGLDIVQLWVLWAWVEASPDVFQFDDYDRLIALAEKHGLKVVLSTVAEIQPYWIHRKAPSSEMINHLGHKVASSNRSECHFGITPGGCTDHPAVWELMSRFLTEVVSRYRGLSHLHGWDAWNELRWNVNANGLVCYCAHTLEKFRTWLDDRFGGLDGLNKVWRRRYSSWDDVWPGIAPKRPFTEMMAWQRFLTWRANEHGKALYNLMKGIDPDHPVTVHAATPCPLCAGYYGQRGGIEAESVTAMDRGNDWFYADDTDGIGTSSFPAWLGANSVDVDFAARVEYIHSAAQGKRVWLSELQGGPGDYAFAACPNPVTPGAQQRWLWSGIAAGADTVLFWCWRNEVFGMESNRFGLAGNDGLEEQRLEAMRKTRELLDKYNELLIDYRPAPADVGVLFSPQTNYLFWCADASAQRAVTSLQAYCKALIRKNVPYCVVEEHHLDALSGLRLLFLPRTTVIDDDTAQRLTAFVEAGGTLVCESECGAFDSVGVYRYPLDRFLADLTGGVEIGRRPAPDQPVRLRLNGNPCDLRAAQWLTPMQTARGDVLARCDEGALVMRVPVGQGHVVLCGSYFGDAYAEEPYAEFETFIEALVTDAGGRTAATVANGRKDGEPPAFVRCGASGEQQLAFVFFLREVGSVTARFDAGHFKQGRVTELISGAVLDVHNRQEKQEVNTPRSEWGMAVLAET